MTNDYKQRFGGIGRLFGKAALERLQRAHVCVVGVGGVGSWAVEALARSGVGQLTLVDLDDVCITNVNRQLPALDGEMGRPKVEVLAQRVRLINPCCEVHGITEFFTKTNAEALLEPGFDFVVDAIDKLANKCLLIHSCLERELPVITVGGAGGKRDPARVSVRDLAHTEQDELLRQVRRKLRRDYGLQQGLHSSAPSAQPSFGIPAVFSPEKPLYPWANGTCSSDPEPDSSLALDCASGFGTATFITGTFGFAAAGEVVRRIALDETAGGTIVQSMRLTSSMPPG